VDKLLPWSVLLFAGLFFSVLVIYFLELPDTKWGILTWKQFHRDMPLWVSQFEIALWVLGAMHLLWLAKTSAQAFQRSWMASKSSSRAVKFLGY
jgi:hypothetical protein